MIIFGVLVSGGHCLSCGKKAASKISCIKSAHFAD